MSYNDLSDKELKKMALDKSDKVIEKMKNRNLYLQKLKLEIKDNNILEIEDEIETNNEIIKTLTEIKEKI